MRDCVGMASPDNVMVIGLSAVQFMDSWNYELDYPWIVRHEVLLPINCVNNKMRESQSWNICINVRERLQSKNMIGYQSLKKNIWIKVTGPVSFIHFSFPIEAGQLTWSQFSHWFWLVIMCYVVKFHWLVAFATWYSLVLYCPITSSW